jgi:hypothetical protein
MSGPAGSSPLRDRGRPGRGPPTRSASPSTVVGMTDEAGTPAIAVTVPPKQEVGVFADFAGIWHTPNTFVLDFLSLTSPGQQVQQLEGSGEVVGALPARVAARVRIPAEQVFQIIAALQQQADQWLEETGRSEPPEAWLPQP